MEALVVWEGRSDASRAAVASMRSGTLGVLDTGERLHLSSPEGRTLCGRSLDPRDLYQQGGHEAWAQRPHDHCQICEARAP